TPDAALRAISSTAVGLIVADIAMPDVDGYELTERARQGGKSRSVPAVAVSAYARPQDRTEAFASGYNGYCASLSRHLNSTHVDVLRPPRARTRPSVAPAA
ncbi:MAG: response regulator, partial [Luteitalea sp.]|nr:response regulator [Luteitalea sp.]